MPLGTGIENIADAIRLAIAPVFLLTGLAGLLNVMATRLARVIDRARSLEASWSGLDTDARSRARLEMHNLERRRRVCSWSINFSTMAALLVCLVIVTLFMEQFLEADLWWLTGSLFVDLFLPRSLKWLVAGLFIAAMVVLIAGLVTFLREVYLATHTLRIGPPRSRA